MFSFFVEEEEEEEEKAWLQHVLIWHTHAAVRTWTGPELRISIITQAERFRHRHVHVVLVWLLRRSEAG